MIISKIALKNWRNFLNVDVNLGDRVFLVGPNASGKSNFLDAFRFLRDIARQGGGLQKAVKDRGGISRIRCLAARRESQVEIKVQISNGNSGAVWSYEIGIKQEPRGKRDTKLIYERVKKNQILIVDRPDKDDLKDKVRLTQTFLEQINANQKFREIAAFLQSVLYLHLVPQLVRHPNAFSGPGIPGDPFGRNFLERVAKTPQKTRRARLRKIERALQLAVPKLKKLEDVKDEIGIPHLEAVYEHWRSRGAKQREDQFSDGTLRLIGLMWALLEGDSLLLLEEPELSLNAGIVSKLSSLIERLQKQRKKQQRQIILSTHSSDLLSDKSIGGEEVLLLTPDFEGTTIKVASSLKDIKLMLQSGLSVAEAVLPRTIPSSVSQLELFNL